MEFSSLFVSAEFWAAALGFLASFIAETFPQFQETMAALKPTQKRAVMIVASAVAGFAGVFIHRALTQSAEPLSADVVYGLAMSILALVSNQATHRFINKPGGSGGIVKHEAKLVTVDVPAYPAHVAETLKQAGYPRSGSAYSSPGSVGYGPRSPEGGSYPPPDAG